MSREFALLAHSLLPLLSLLHFGWSLTSEITRGSPRWQGRSQEETTTEANTRSVVRNQPYEIF